MQQKYRRFSEITKSITVAVLFLAGLALPALAAEMVPVFSTDFNNGVPTEFSGITVLESVHGYAGIGTGSNTFSGDFLQNTSGGLATGMTGTPGTPTVLTLTDLPSHYSLNINFLLAIIDSWDGLSNDPPFDSFVPDYFEVRVDGATIFLETFDNFVGGDGTYIPPPGVALTPTPLQLGFNPGPDFLETAYNMGLDSAFQNIPHTSSTLTIEWLAYGDGWQGGGDESWAIDNVDVTVNTPEPSTVCLLLFGIISLGYSGFRRRRASTR